MQLQVANSPIAWFHGAYLYAGLYNERMAVAAEWQKQFAVAR